MGKLEYGIFHGKAIVDAVRKTFSFDELKELALYKRDRISAADVEAYAKKVSKKVVDEMLMSLDHTEGCIERESFNIFPNSYPTFTSLPDDSWKKKIKKIIVGEIKEEYIEWLVDNHFIPTDFVDFDDLKKYDDLDDKDFWKAFLDHED